MMLRIIKCIKDKVLTADSRENSECAERGDGVAGGRARRHVGCDWRRAGREGSLTFARPRRNLIPAVARMQPPS